MLATALKQASATPWRAFLGPATFLGLRVRARHVATTPLAALAVAASGGGGKVAYVCNSCGADAVKVSVHIASPLPPAP